jgi:L-threonylcarbamoyladenylate synthase
LTTSANVSDEPDTLGADEVLIAFATQQEALDVVLDGGAVPGGVPSTVVDLTVTPARVLREGAVAREAIAEVVDLEA